MNNNSLWHHGIKGQTWGVRRFQNEDGSLTEEGKRRYLADANKHYELYNKAATRTDEDIRRINKKYEHVDLNDDVANLSYTKEVNEAFKKNYREVLAEDIGTDEASLKGQKWLDLMLGYRNSLDKEVADLEKKVKNQHKEQAKTEKQTKSNSENGSSKEKYAKTKMSQEKAIKTAYDDLEKMHPDFNKLPLDKQDELFFDYINESGLSRWM